MNNQMIGMTVALTFGAVLASGLQARAEEPFCALRVGWNTAEPKFWPQMREALASRCRASRHGSAAIFPLPPPSKN